MMDREQKTLIRLVQGAGLLVILTAGAGLVLFALNGRFSRFWADDYAYSRVMLDGLLEGTKNWYNLNGARLSSFWLVGISDLFGMGAVRYLPALTILLWVGSIIFLLKSMLDFIQVKINWIWLGLTAVILVFFSVYLMPTRLETLYWRMGTLHYTLPIPLTLIILGLTFIYLRLPSAGLKTILRGLLLLVLAFLSGANGEASGAWQTGVFLAALAMVWLYNRKNRRRTQTVYFVFALAGSLLAILVMAKSPANQWRMELMPPPANLGEFVYYTLRYSFDFVVDSFKTQPLPNLVFVIGSLAAALTGLPEKSGNFLKKYWLPSVTAALVIAFGLIVFSVAPSVYAGKYYPAPRALIAARFSLLAGLMTAAFFIGAWLRNIAIGIKPATWSMVIAVILLVVSIYTVRAYRVPILEGRDLAGKAELWDKQDADIKAAKQAGELDVVIQQVDVVDTLYSFFDDPTHWMNQSAAVLYGVNSITALP